MPSYTGTAKYWEIEGLRVSYLGAYPERLCDAEQVT